MRQTLFGILLVSAKILLFALLAALGVLLLALISRVGIRFRIKEDGETTLWAKIGFFRLNLTRLAAFRAAWQRPPKPRLLTYTKDFGIFGQVPQAVKRPSQKKAAHSKSTNAPKKSKKKPDVLSILRQITDFLSAALTRLSGNGRIRVRRLVLVSAAPEAADTAVLFGQMNAALAVLMHTSGRFRQLKTEKAKIGVYADFNADDARMDADLECDFRAWVLLRVAIDAAKTYLAVKKSC